MRSTREALIAEALGELATLLDRVEAVVPALEAAGNATEAASDRMTAQALDAEQRLLARIEAARTHTAKHIATHAAQAMRQARDAEIKQFSATTRELLRDDLASMIRQLEQARLHGRPVALSWTAAAWTHLAASAVAALATWACMTP